jgi:transposase
MGRFDELIGPLRLKLEVVVPWLNEKQRRLLYAAEARQLGHGGITAVAEAAGVSKGCIQRGLVELEEDAEPSSRVRRPGGGRRPATEKDPELTSTLLELVEDGKRGDPIGPLLWTTKSLRTLADELTARGHQVGRDTVADLLKAAGYSLRGNAKVLEGTHHPDRDAQFTHLNTQVAGFLASGDPVISVDCKKKEIIGLFGQPGQVWTAKDAPVKVLDHDFPSDAEGTAIPYGIYDLGRNTGYVVVGTDHDTAAFAVAAIRRWWNEQGRHTYPNATRLLITADGGGSNASRAKAWKANLAVLATEIGLPITVCHLPPGTSKWNRVEHRLFSFISMNWRARPLTSLEVAVNLIANTTNRGGLTVTARLDERGYPTGIEIDKQHMAALKIETDAFHGDWNYTMPPQPGVPLPPTEPPLPKSRPSAGKALDTAVVTHPALTGLSRTRLDQLTYEMRQLATSEGTAPSSRRPKLTFEQQAWAAILDQRGVSRSLIAHLLHVSEPHIRTLLKTVGPLLERHGHTSPRITHRLVDPSDLTGYLMSMPSTPS